jgi:hypothetical protein
MTVTGALVFSRTRRDESSQTPFSLPIAFRLAFFSHITVPIATLARLELRSNDREIGSRGPVSKFSL